MKTNESKGTPTLMRIRLWIIVLTIAAASGYFGSYFVFRLNHTFIHRAGYYLYDPRREVGINTNHYIEPAMVADGPQIFAMGAVAAIATGQELKSDDEQFNRILEEVGSQIAMEESKRWRLFTFYKPAVFFETIIWKLVNPHPTIPR